MAITDKQVQCKYLMILNITFLVWKGGGDKEVSADNNQIWNFNRSLTNKWLMMKLGDTYINLNPKNPTCSSNNYSSQWEKYQDSNTCMKNTGNGFLFSILVWIHLRALPKGHCRIGCTSLASPVNYRRPTKRHYALTQYNASLDVYSDFVWLQ
jgi:hypothetical protein